ncbi:MAG: hypothetical protein P8X97_07560 [Candidatus Bathyarchaeota archaeon]
MLSEILNDEQLIKLYTESGFLVVVDYTKNEVRLHTVDCMLADPISTIGVKPSKVRARVILMLNALSAILNFFNICCVS